MSFKTAYMNKGRLRHVQAVRARAMAYELAALVRAGATDDELLAHPATRTVADVLELDGARLIRLLRDDAAPTTHEENLR